MQNENNAVAELFIQDTRKKINIRDADDNNKIIGVAKFDPDDIMSYEKLTNIFQDLSNMQKIAIKSAKKENLNLPEVINTIDDLMGLDDVFANIKEITGELKEAILCFKNNIDVIFGKGICDLILGKDEYNFAKIIPLIEVATPFYEKARHDKVKKYKINEQAEILQ